jgi:hypothetical protein
MKVLRWFAGITLVLAIIGVVLGVYAISRFEPKADVNGKVGSLAAQVKTLKAQLASNASKLATAQSDVQSLQNSTTAGQVTALKRKVQQVESCIPELQTELGGLGINWSINGFNANKDSFTITNPTIISTDCSSVLYGAD